MTRLIDSKQTGSFEKKGEWQYFAGSFVHFMGVYIHQSQVITRVRSEASIVL